MPNIEAKSAKVLGQVIKAARQASGQSAEELTEHLGITPQYLSRMENGCRTLWSTRLFRIQNHLGVKVTLSYPPKGE